MSPLSFFAVSQEYLALMYCIISSFFSRCRTWLKGSQVWKVYLRARRQQRYRARIGPTTSWHCDAVTSDAFNGRQMVFLSVSGFRGIAGQMITPKWGTSWWLRKNNMEIVVPTLFTFSFSIFSYASLMCSWKYGQLRNTSKTLESDDMSRVVEVEVEVEVLVLVLVLALWGRERGRER